MNRDGHNKVDLFIGAEVEHTPAYSKRTLFVVGDQPLEKIEAAAKEHKTPHVFLGANHSFDETISEYWNSTITALLDKGYWVTLDYPAHLHTDVLKMLSPGVWQCRTFVPLLSVRIAHVQTSSANLTIKIDDIDFDATNPGVWCLHHHEITDSNRFTGWSEYATDEVIKPVELAPTSVSIVTKTAETSITQVPVKTAVTTSAAAEPEVSVVLKEVKNDPEVGIDTEPTSALKVDPDLEEIVQRPQLTPGEALEAYAEGAGEVEVKKATKAKK